MIHLGETVALYKFVDDANTMDWDRTSRGPKASGMVITNMLDKLALEACGERLCRLLLVTEITLHCCYEGQAGGELN